jgi:hypothetical protein
MWYPLRGERLTAVQKKVLVLHKQKKQQFGEQYLGELRRYPMGKAYLIKQNNPAFDQLDCCFSFLE